MTTSGTFEYGKDDNKVVHSELEGFGDPPTVWFTVNDKVQFTVKTGPDKVTEKYRAKRRAQTRKIVIEAIRKLDNGNANIAVPQL
jgi:hypothetical protein